MKRIDISSKYAINYDYLPILRWTKIEITKIKQLNYKIYP